MDKEPTKIVIDNSNKSFFTDNVSVLHNENNFIIDFKQTTPRMDFVHDKQDISFVTTHNTVVMNPAMAKSLKEVLQDSIEKYEKQFSEIKMPKKKKADKKVVETTGTNYIG